MRPLALAAAALASLGIAMAGCAALEGLSSISEQACAPDCDGGASADGTAPGPGEDGSSSVTDDRTLPDDTTTPLASDDSPAGEDAPASNDAPSTSDSEAPDASDAGEDTGTTTPVDAGADTGCGPLDTVANCGACLSACTATNATAPSCNGTTCSYTCNSGYLDCNYATPRDVDGCECNAPGATAADCCSGACPQQHHWELGIVGNTTFYDCIAPGTFNVGVATDACTAFAGGDSSQCDYDNYIFSCTYPDGGLAGDLVCANGPGVTKCNCWGYDGAFTGLMSTGNGKCALPDGGQALNFNCPSSLQWN